MPQRIPYLSSLQRYRYRMNTIPHTEDTLCKYEYYFFCCAFFPAAVERYSKVTDGEMEAALGVHLKHAPARTGGMGFVLWVALKKVP